MRSSTTRKRAQISGYWAQEKHQRNLLESLAKKLSIKTHEDWYKISQLDVRNFGGGQLINIYNQSFINALINLLPEHDWKIWKFTQASKHFWTNPSNQKKAMNQIFTELKFTKLEDWYSVTPSMIAEDQRFKFVRNIYRSSIYKALVSIYPEYNWLPWRFSQKKPEYWHDKENQKRFLLHLAKEKKLDGMEGFYLISKEDFATGNLPSLLRLFDGNIGKLVTSNFPEFPWQLWKFKYSEIPHGYWHLVQNQRDFLDDFAKAKNIKTEDDWNLVKVTDIINYGGVGIKNQYAKASLQTILSNVYPEISWHWKSSENSLKSFFEELAKKLNINNHEDWYQVKKLDVIDASNGNIIPILERYEGSLRKALMDTFPRTFKIYRFHYIPSEHWKDKTKQILFFEELGKRLGYKNKEDWYEVKQLDIEENGGATLLEIHRGSVINALSFVYPDFPWASYKFIYLPKEPEKWNEEQSKEALKWIEETFGITKPEDWYSISSTQIRSLGMKSFVDKYGGLMNLLSTFYPNFLWENSNRLFQFASKAQQILFKYITETFPSLEIHENYMHPEISFDNSTKTKMELDVYIPHFNVAFEYQGEQHFGDEIFFFNKTEDLLDRDSQKKRECKRLGITLIEIPYWWDQRKESLLSTIHYFRPDIVKEPGNGKMISKTPPISRTRRQSFNKEIAT